MINRCIRLYIGTGLTAMLVLSASPAHAQYTPETLNAPPAGERFHIERNASWLFPSATITVASEGFGISGSAIDFKNDLGVEDKRMTPEPHAPARRVTSSGFSSFPSNTKRLRPASQIASTAEIPGERSKSTSTGGHTLGHEFDFITKNHGFAGFIVEGKYTDVQVQLDAVTSSVSINEFARARLPLPALGGIGRYYVVPNISITGEVTAFKLPDSIDSRYGGHYVDMDIYGTVNFTGNVGAQVGYRSLDLGYLVKEDTGTFRLKGLYFGLVASREALTGRTQRTQRKSVGVKSVVTSL
jgi:hypothetical protein